MKTFSTSGTGSQQTLSPIETDKIPVYDSVTDAESDLANLAENQIIATHDTGSELSAPVDTVQSGNMHAVTSNAVAEATLTGQEVSITTSNNNCTWYIGKCFKTGKIVQIFGIINIPSTSETRTIATGLPIPLGLQNQQHDCNVYIAGAMGNILGNVSVNKNGNLNFLNATFSGGNFYFGGTYICE